MISENLELQFKNQNYQEEHGDIQFTTRGNFQIKLEENTLKMSN